MITKRFFILCLVILSITSIHIAVAQRESTQSISLNNDNLNLTGNSLNQNQDPNDPNNGSKKKKKKDKPDQDEEPVETNIQPSVPLIIPTVAPLDSDADGIPDFQDNCPDVYGADGVGGCPLPIMPQSGDCLVATDGAYKVNVRDDFSLTGAVVKQLTPLGLYPVYYRASVPPEDPDTSEPILDKTANIQTWYLVDAGWVSGAVTRIGGDCDSVPDLFIPIGDDMIGDPPVLCEEEIVVVFEDFDPADRASIGASTLWRLDTPDVVVSGTSYIGTECDEFIFASPDINIINGMGGNDVIYGFGANDTILGGDGDDTIYGGAGNDLLFGNNGEDTVNGNAGRDRVYGGGGGDRLYGADGDDRLFGEMGRDSLSGGNGNDRLLGGEGNDRLYSGLGSDGLYGGNGNDRLDAWDMQQDTLRGGDGNDTIRYTTPPGFATGIPVGSRNINTVIEGNAGDDSLYVLLFDDDIYNEVSRLSVYGNEGNDTLEGNAFMYGGDGNDRFRLIGNADVNSYSLAWGEGGDDTFGVFEYTFELDVTVMFGGDGDDIMDGGRGRDYMFGEDGDDILKGRANSDRLLGGNGDDTLYGAIPWNNRSFWGIYVSDPSNFLDGGGGADVMVGGPSRWDICMTGMFDGDIRTSCESDGGSLADRLRRGALEILDFFGVEYTTPSP